MAIPPEPIREVIDAVEGVVIGEVTHVLERWKQPPMPKANPEATDVPGTLSKQKVRLKVSEVLHGDYEVGQLIEVIKPDGDYLLRVGNRGPFLLGEPLERLKSPTILGRYGPDSYRRDVIENALANRS